VLPGPTGEAARRNLKRPNDATDQTLPSGNRVARCRCAAAAYVPGYDTGNWLNLGKLPMIAGELSGPAGGGTSARGRQAIGRVCDTQALAAVHSLVESTDVTRRGQGRRVSGLRTGFHGQRGWSTAA